MLWQDIFSETHFSEDLKPWSNCSVMKQAAMIVTLLFTGLSQFSFINDCAHRTVFIFKQTVYMASAEFQMPLDGN